ncbi:MAG: ribonuclease Z [Paludibacter sp.]|nr:ribonuclease Z [Bacteroidales bacterium]MCM1069751.1 ribonuclease Z [Prevotella sp.]MCM1354436.1 ribonuclease Z [Bacteroides sp.]MCM1443226.1 ribonuclease Z [Muribaculum sp.]MCM1482470.1 ribonuclease Z [Paludibacter sp.]
MSEHRLTILGCGSAMPTRLHNPSGQLLEMCEKQFLIDCGEGVQITLRRMSQRITRMDTIFISHLHGDHCFGLMGLLSTLGMLGRTRAIHIYAQPDLERLMRPWLDYFCQGMSYDVIFHSINPRKNEVVYEDRTLTVTTIPLKHRVPCCGFLFEEKPRERHIVRDMLDVYGIPLCSVPALKRGEDYVTEDGTVIPNDRLTTAPTPPFRYAYCSDTAYYERIVPIISGVDCLYHETTYTEEYAERAKETQHSTARQAAMIARQANVKQLIIGHYSARYEEPNVLLEEAKTVFPNVLMGKEETTYTL